MSLSSLLDSYGPSNVRFSEIDTKLSAVLQNPDQTSQRLIIQRGCGEERRLSAGKSITEEKRGNEGQGGKEQ